MVSYDGDAGTAKLYVDEVDDENAGATGRVAPITGTLATGAATIHVGINHGETQFYLGKIGYIGLRDAYLTNPTDFGTGAVPEELDEVTWTEWGAQPLYWQDEGTMTANLGSAGNMTANGTITGPA